MNNIQHSSKSNEHYTPIEIIEAARKLMGFIELDPASCRLADKNVNAKKYYSKKEDAINMDISEWKAETLFLNPPGGCIKKDENGKWIECKKGQSAQAIWWDKLTEAYEADYVEEAIFLSFSLELIGKRGNSLLNPDYYLCFTSGDVATSNIITRTGRTKFNKPVDGEIVTNPSPTHANLIVYLPQKDRYDLADNFKKFNKSFSKFGVCRRFK
jgi:hypothetical protein